MQDDTGDLRRARGKFIANLIKEDDRSARYVALQIGLNPTSMGERLHGKSPFLADELELIARVLKIDPLKFYSSYIKAGHGDYHATVSRTPLVRKSRPANRAGSTGPKNRR